MRPEVIPLAAPGIENSTEGSTEDFLNRDLSWLEFNRRVLHEAVDERTPLLERADFLASSRLTWTSSS